MQEAEGAVAGLASALDLLREAWNLTEEEMVAVRALCPAVTAAVVLNAQAVRMESPIRKVLADAALSLERGELPRDAHWAASWP